MSLPPLRVSLVLAIASLGCVRDPVPVGTSVDTRPIATVAVVSRLCTGEELLEGVTGFTARVNGTVVATGDRARVSQFRLDPVSAGTFTLTALGVGGTPRALGSAPIDVQRDDVSLTVIMRPLDRFFPLGSAAGKCAVLGTPRAAHQATQLFNGKVLVTGGYEETGADSSRHLYTAAAEAVDVASGTVSPAAPLSDGPRAFHAAVPLVGGVLVMGGERSVAGAMEVTRSTLFYAPERDAWARLGPYDNFSLGKPRSRAQIGVDPAGRVLLVGGYTSSDGHLVSEPSYEWFDGQTFWSGRAMIGGRVMGAMAHLSDTAFVFTGGTDGSRLLTSSASFNFTEVSSFYPEQLAPPSLTLGRTRSAFARIAPDRLVVAGGDEGQSPDGVTRPTAAIEVIRHGSAGPPLSSVLPEAVADACAVEVGGRVLVIGGERIDGIASARVITLAVADDTLLIGESSPLAQARTRHTCTLLRDGSVLVVGGVTRRGPTGALPSLELYLPAP